MTARFSSTEITRAIEQPVELADYDAAWPLQFEAERRRLTEALPDAFVAIEHIGSTAVEGLRAKPLIDLLAAVRSMDEARALSGPLQDIGYTTSPELNATLTSRQWFMRQSGGRRTHHLHVVVQFSHDWIARVSFRDRLRTDPAFRHRYESLKEDLALRYADDREAYTEGKSAFISAATEDRETP